MILRSGTCGHCGHTQTWNRESPAPLCCGQMLVWSSQREHLPAFHGFGTGMRAPAIDFNQTRGRIAPVLGGTPVNSLHDIRRIERESEQREANGDGQAYQFVKYSMDRGNETRGMLHTSEPIRTHDNQGRPVITAVPTDPAAADAASFGPGIVNDGDSGFPS